MMENPAYFRPWQSVLLRVFLAFGLLLTILPLPSTTANADPASGPDAARVVSMITWLSGETPFQTTRIYDRRGEPLADIDDWGRRTIVGFDEIPDFLVKATIATEDRRFYAHNGVDYRAIARAAWQNTQAEDIVSGGSTITQQLARLLFMPPSERYEQTMTRKMKEAQLAIDLERYYSKEEILAMYLNMVYYGHHAYGVAAAAEVYFDKPLADLTPAECALLAGLPQSPVQYDPVLHPQAALQRRQVVLALMVEAGVIDAAQAAKIQAQPLHLHPYQRPQNKAPHFVDYIKNILVERFGTEGIHWGYQAHTSLDLRYQELAERIARAQVQTVGEKHHFNNAAVVMLHPANGGILAMVGSIDFDNQEIHGQVNMAVEPRQPGSSIKPVLYAAAFDRGWSPASVIWDQPVSYRLAGRLRYVPTNITHRYYGPLRLRMALSNSLNVPAVKLLAQVGVPAMLETAQKLGIRAWRKPAKAYGLSLAVGGYEVPLLELTHAFATIAHEGVYTPLHPITLLEDGTGKVVYRADPAGEQRQAISPVAAYQLASVLSDARARNMMFRRPSPLDTSQITAVKTGTTDGWRDNLTVGFTRYLAVGVWTGNSDSRPMEKAIGLYTAGPIWHDVMEAVWANPALFDALGYTRATLPQGFSPPPDAVTIPVCDWMPGKFNPNCPRMLEEVFPANAAKLPPAGRLRGYCLPAGAEEAPVETYFLSLPKDDAEATRARDWMRRRFGRTVQDLDTCDTTVKARRLVEQPDLLPPRQLVQAPDEQKASAASAKPASHNGE
jgi:penicillin-binding protein 1C